MAHSCVIYLGKGRQEDGESETSLGCMVRQHPDSAGNPKTMSHSPCPHSCQGLATSEGVQVTEMCKGKSRTSDSFPKALGKSIR